MRRWMLVLTVVFSLFGTLYAQDADIDLTPPTLGDFDPDSVKDLDINDYPVLPPVTDHARRIYEQGIEAGNSAQVFSKVGDCMTAAAYFMTPFGLDDYDLGEYADLQAVIDYFGAVPARGDDFEFDSFANPGLATASGFNTASVLDPIWANPQFCQANESPLACEYRQSHPAFALIMFGTNDVYIFEAESFDFYLRTIVLDTIQNDIVPVLYTFPNRPEFPEKTVLFNQIVIKIAIDYDLPLVNLWLAIKDLPDEGVDPVQPIHLSIPPDEKTGDFANNLDYGYTVRNLITLQALDILRTGLAEAP